MKLEKVYFQEWCKYPESLAEQAMQGVTMYGLVLCETSQDLMTQEIKRRIIKWEELNEATE